MKPQNKKPNQYDWLLIAEGQSDIDVYKAYLKDYSIGLLKVGGKGYSLNVNAWDTKHIDKIVNDVGRRGFRGIIIVIDTDADVVNPFAQYSRSTDNHLSYTKPEPAVRKCESGSFWNLDELNGNEATIVVRGINVPRSDEGCLESDLLASYGFPVSHQPEYESLVNIVKTATRRWGIPDNNDGKKWWELNERAKMDKFIYAALKAGFLVSGKEPTMPQEPEVIANIRAAMSQ